MRDRKTAKPAVNMMETRAKSKPSAHNKNDEKKRTVPASDSSTKSRRTATAYTRSNNFVCDCVSVSECVCAMAACDVREADKFLRPTFFVSNGNVGWVRLLQWPTNSVWYACAKTIFACRLSSVDGVDAFVHNSRSVFWNHPPVEPASVRQKAGSARGRKGE